MPVGIGIGRPQRLATHLITIQFVDAYEDKTDEQIRDEVSNAFRFFLGHDRMELVKVQPMKYALEEMKSGVNVKKEAKQGST